MVFPSPWKATVLLLKTEPSGAKLLPPAFFILERNTIFPPLEYPGWRRKLYNLYITSFIPISEVLPGYCFVPERYFLMSLKKDTIIMMMTIPTGNAAIMLTD